ncbi:MAG: hypothetical protein H6538_01495 [Bacteroidales bacterium]|nr:hypothetical protein [Bacteroidales bacterium]
MIKKLINSAKKFILPGIFIFQINAVSGQEIVADSALAKNLAELKELYIHDRRSADTWWQAWMYGYAGATVAQSVAAIAGQDKNFRQDMALGAATTFAGVIGQVITPIPPKRFELEAFESSCETNEALVRETLYYKELLRQLSEREKEGRSWKTHAAATLVNAGSGLITWKAYNRSFRDGLINFAINSVITEAQIWSQPVRAIKDYQKYINSEFPPQAYKSPHNTQWIAGLYPGGFSLRLEF